MAVKKIISSLPPPPPQPQPYLFPWPKNPLTSDRNSHNEITNSIHTERGRQEVTMLPIFSDASPLHLH
jgi:hypothetical protein